MVVIDDEFLSSLRESLEEDSSVSDGMGVEPESDKAFKRIERLSATRDRCVFELRQRLDSEEFSEKAIDDAIERAKRCGLVDDMRFADAFIRGRVSAGKGLAGILRDLEQRNIDAYELDGFPKEYLLDTHSQFDRAIAILETRPPKAKDATGAAYRRLVGKGYGTDIAFRAAKTWSSHSA